VVYIVNIVDVDGSEINYPHEKLTLDEILYLN